MILAVTSRIKKDKDEKQIFYANKDYIDSFKEFDIQFLQINNITNDIEKIVSICDGLIVVGGIDICPENYNENPHSSVKSTSREIDTLDFELIRKFSQVNKPILGICRGIQSINVCFGGNLYQDIPNHRLNESERHKVNIEKESILHKIYKKEYIYVNSLHHQAVKRIADGFKIVAVSDDDIIEAIEKDNILAVQWHPERLKDRVFFEGFVSHFMKEKK